MCLDKGWKKLKKGDKKEGVGYKVFTIGLDGTLRSHVFGTGGELPTGWWMNECDYRGLTNEFPESYGYGFHVLKSLKGASYWKESMVEDSVTDVVYKVKYRKATTTGEQEGYKCIVAKEIYIYPSVDK